MHWIALFNLDPEHVAAWFEWGGYFILFGLLFACGLGLPLPEDIPLLLGGYFVAAGKMHLALVAILAWSGIIGGDCCLYWLARRYGLNVTRVRFIGRHVTQERILWAEEKFEKYGILVVAVCRLFAGVRGAMVIAAGAIRFNFAKFVIADGLAAIVSGGLFVALGYYAGKKLGSIAEIRKRIHHYEGYVIAGLILVAILVGLYLWWRHRKHSPLSEAALTKVDNAATRVREHRAAKAGGALPPTGPDAGEA